MAEVTGWRTSTRTQGQGQCVEVGFAAGTVVVRDTKNRAVGISVTARHWRRFVERIVRGGLDSRTLQERLQ